VCCLLFVEEEHLYAALACFFGLVAVNNLILLYHWWVGELCEVGEFLGSAIANGCNDMMAEWQSILLG
jgi:hypothetical protein